MSSFTKFSPLCFFYLVCTVAGLIVPWYFNIGQMLWGAAPFTLANFWAAGFANYFVSSLTSDFLIAASAVSVWILVEGRRLKIRFYGVFIVLSLVVSFAFACPLFLFVREQRLLHSKK